MRLLSKGLAVIGLSMSTIFPALAVETTPEHADGLISMLPMLIIFIAVFYFLLIRPQSKRAKQHREQIASLKVGDEIVTTAGILGVIEKITDDHIVVSVHDDVHLTLEKSAVHKSVPKGTLKSVK